MVKLKCGITDRIMPFLLITKYFDCCRLMKRWKMLVMIMAKLIQKTNGKVVYIYDGKDTWTDEAGVEWNKAVK